MRSFFDVRFKNVDGTAAQCNPPLRCDGGRAWKWATKSWA